MKGLPSHRLYAAMINILPWHSNRNLHFCKLLSNFIDIFSNLDVCFPTTSTSCNIMTSIKRIINKNIQQKSCFLGGAYRTRCICKSNSKFIQSLNRTTLLQCYYFRYSGRIIIHLLQFVKSF